MRFGLLATFVGAIALVTWDELAHNQRVPHPDRYNHVAVVWAILGIVSELGVPELAALFGFGYLLSMLYTFLQAPQTALGAEENASTGVGEGNQTDKG